MDQFSGRPVIEVAVHHFEGGEYLEEILAEMGEELIYTPTYSPDLNPIEFYNVKLKI